MESFTVDTELLLHVPAAYLLEKVLKKQQLGTKETLLITAAVSTALTYLHEKEKNTASSAKDTLLFSIIYGLLSAGSGHYFSDLLPNIFS